MPGWEVIGEEEKNAVVELFDRSGILCSQGFDAKRNGLWNVRDFQSEFADYFGAKYAVAVSSGTAGLKVALKSVGVKEGDEVITQAFNFIATVEAIRDCAATPIMTNIDDSLNMDPADLEKRITPKTKAVIVVHMLGNAANIESISRICKERNIKLIEDNCESPGAKWNGQYLGTFGDAGVFSFDMGKMITCGEGGMVISNDEKVWKYAKEYHDHGHENNPNFPRGEDTRSIYGFNYRMTEMQAAVGRVQLKKLDKILLETRNRWHAINEVLGKLPKREVFTSCEIMGDTFMFKVDNSELRKQVIDILLDKNIGIKNVPSAIKWHCAGFWDHILDEREFLHSQKTKEVLSKYVAIPINLSTTIESYIEVSELINQKLNN